MAATLGLSGVSRRVAADPVATSDLTPRRLVDEFGSAEAVTRVLESTGVLDRLSAAGVVEEPTVDALGVEALTPERVAFGDTAWSPSRPDTVDGLTGSCLLTAAAIEGQLTPELVVVTEVAAGTVILTAFPEFDEAGAKLLTDDGVETITTGVDPAYVECPSSTNDDGDICIECLDPKCFDNCYGCLRVT